MQRLSIWLPVVLWMGIIFAFSARESVRLADQSSVNFVIFKTFHVIEYAILYFLYYRAVRNARFAFVLTIAYAITDELHQTLVPTREGRPRDVIIDAIGAILAWTILTRLLPKAPKKLKTLAKNLGVN